MLTPLPCPTCWYCNREAEYVDRDRSHGEVATCEQCHEDCQRGLALDKAYEEHTCVEWKHD